MTKFADLLLDKVPELKDKALYIISTESLANKNLYKVGFSGCQLKNRLSQINEILSPSLQEHLRIYGLVVPKPGRSGVDNNVRAKELNQLEKEIHALYKRDGLLECFPGSHRYSEWIREEKLSRLFKRIDKIFAMPTSTYRLHFQVQDWQE